MEREVSRREAARARLRAGEWTSAPDLYRSEDARIDGDWADLRHRGSSAAAWRGLDPGELIAGEGEEE